MADNYFHLISINSMKKKHTYQALGVMSGTSLDGLDFAYCTFEWQENNWKYTIEKAITIPYSDVWKERLFSIETGDALAYVKTDWALGNYIGKEISKFLTSNTLKPDFIASHGHTIFHQPNKNEVNKAFTAQIGNGAAIAARTDTTVISDFRVTDVALGGEGAPLVPIGDQLLFSTYNYCLNLGGIANISAEKDSKRLAFDICVCNMALNHLANLKGLDFDDKGKIAASGNFKGDLFNVLNQLPFFHTQGPKSLGKEWFLGEVLPVLNKFSYDIADTAHTFVHHIAYQINKTCQMLSNKAIKESKMLVTGGGAFHNYLITVMKQQMPEINIYIPNPLLLEFKEAMIFALLGVLKWRGEDNCLSSVTGATKNSCGGVIHYP